MPTRAWAAQSCLPPASLETPATTRDHEMERVSAPAPALLQGQSILGLLAQNEPKLIHSGSEKSL